MKLSSRWIILLLLGMGMTDIKAVAPWFLNPCAECDIFTTTGNEWSAAPGTRIKIQATPTAWKFEGQLRQTPGEPWVVKGHKNSELSLFGGEVVEFFIAPPGQSGVYYHLAISPSKTIYSAKIRDVKWSPAGLKLNSFLEKDCWHFTLILPYRALGVPPPQPGEVWRLNIARNWACRGKSIEYSSWGGGKNFHDLRRFIPVVLWRPAPTSRVVLRQVKSSPLHTEYVFSGALPRRIKVTQQRGGTEPRTLNLAVNSANREFTVTFPAQNTYLPLKSADIVNLTVRDAATDQVLFQERRGLKFEVPQLLKLDRFYYRLADRQLTVHNHFPGVVTWKIYAENQMVMQGQTAEKKFVVDLSALRRRGSGSSRYIVELSNGQLRASQLFWYWDDLPPAAVPAPGILRAKSGQLQQGGRPIYLYSVSPCRRRHWQFAPELNLAYHNNGARPGAVQLLELPQPKLIWQPFLGRLYPDPAIYVQNLVKAVKKSAPELPAFYRISYEASISQAAKLSDGRWVRQDCLPWIAQGYQALKKQFPERLFSLQVDAPSQFKAYSPYCDIFEAACYSSSYNENLIRRLDADLRNLQAQCPPNKPVIYWLGGTVPNASCRLAEEIRCAVYWSLLRGCAGNIVHLGHGQLSAARSRLWSVLSGLGREIEPFFALWSSGTPVQGIIPEVPDLVTAARRLPSGEVVVLAINRTFGEAVWHWPTSGQVKSFPEGKILNPEKSGGVTIKFTPLEPRIFILNPRS